MADQHFPGPWTVGEPADYDDFAVGVWAQDGDHVVALVKWADGFPPGECGEANARLIAAAPDLLAACAVALPSVVGCSVLDCRGTSKPGCRLCCTRNQIIAALKKARG